MNRSIAKPTLTILFLLHLFIFHRESAAQIVQPFPHGIGFEIGGGHNQLFWNLIGSDVSGDRIEFSLTPTVRVTYLLAVAEQADVEPFVGYNRFGGVSTEKSNGYKDEYWFDAVEFGFSGIYNLAGFRLGVGVKVNWHMSATINSFGSLTDPASSDREWKETDLISEWNFPRWSSDIGGRAGYQVDQFLFSAEAWFGITDLLHGSIFDGAAEARENHYRVLVGYVL